MGERVETERGIAYGPSGMRLDVYRPRGATGRVPVVLLWHGRGPEERDVLAPLAEDVAARGAAVVVPDWRSDDPDGGWTHLTESVEFVREKAAAYCGDPERIVLAGWSLGALAGADLVLHPERVGGWRPAAFVGIAGKYTCDKPEMGMDRSPVDALRSRTARFPVPAELVHGTRDTIVDAGESRAFRDVLAQQGCRVSLTETDADHAGVVKAEFAPDRERCVPAHGGAALPAGETSAAVVARAAGL